MDTREADPRTTAGRCLGCSGWCTVNGRPCPECAGTGVPRSLTRNTAPVPVLTAAEAEALKEGTATVPGRLRCQGCQGHGTVNGCTCRDCRGKGWG